MPNINMAANFKMSLLNNKPVTNVLNQTSSTTVAPP